MVRCEDVKGGQTENDERERKKKQALEALTENLKVEKKRDVVCVCAQERGGGGVSVWRSESKQVEKMRGANVAAAGDRAWRGEKMKNAR